jgi:hypothetical protein
MRRCAAEESGERKEAEASSGSGAARRTGAPLELEISAPGTV